MTTEKDLETKKHVFPKTFFVFVMLLFALLKFTDERKEIKVKVVTLTGKSIPVYVEHDATIRMLKVTIVNK